jgi:hypothetical protein|tara:strand:- start:610 stop:747 length:138 start_codon:yes stop_codon:yes gene_type:complete
MAISPHKKEAMGKDWKSNTYPNEKIKTGPKKSKPRTKGVKVAPYN